MTRPKYLKISCSLAFPLTSSSTIRLVLVPGKLDVLVMSNVSSSLSGSHLVALKMIPKATLHRTINLASRLLILCRDSN